MEVLWEFESDNLKTHSKKQGHCTWKKSKWDIDAILIRLSPDCYVHCLQKVFLQILQYRAKPPSLANKKHSGKVQLLNVSPFFKIFYKDFQKLLHTKEFAKRLFGGSVYCALKLAFKLEWVQANSRWFFVSPHRHALSWRPN